MPNEVRIGFTTAKLAKEKGCVVKECMYWYHADGTEAGDFEDLWNVKIEDYFKHECILRLTQSSLQKWLRDEHGLHIILHICLSMEGGYFGYSGLEVVKVKGNDYIHTSTKEISPEPYEKALEHALQLALQEL